MTLARRSLLVCKLSKARMVSLLALIMILFLLMYYARMYLRTRDALKTEGDQLLRSYSHPGLRNRSLVPAVRVRGLDCSKLFVPGNNEAKKLGAIITESAANNLDIEQFLLEAKRSTDYCKTLWYDRCYVNEPLTDEEVSYPIAYSILMYKDVVQLERLLRAIYRPQNYYCVHVDKSSAELVHRAVRAIVSCFHNVFLASRTIDVKWGSFSVLEAELLCMKDLLAYKAWKYFINLTGQEFPLKTNLAIVRILKALNGSNHIAGMTRMVQRRRFKNAPPLTVNVTLTKGSVHILATKAFVDYAINSQPARQFLEWVKDTDMADETFFGSLNHSPHLGVPGAYTGVQELGASYQFIARYKVWSDVRLPCSGKFVSGVCVLGVGDLERLQDSKALFANKFHTDFEPVAYDCMEEWILNRTRGDLEAGAKVINTTFYSQLNHVQHHVAK